MSKFHFRLATLQKLRETHRDEMRAKLAEAFQAEKLLEERIQAIHDEASVLQQARRDSLQIQKTNVNQLLSSQRYSAVLRGQISTMQQQTQTIAVEIEKRRLALVEADKEVRVLEKLCEKQLQAHRKQAMVAEAKVMDEIASKPQEFNL